MEFFLGILALACMFEAMNFVYYLEYMGIGMLGVFMIVGIIMVATYLVGKTRKKDTE